MPVVDELLLLPPPYVWPPPTLAWAKEKVTNSIRIVAINIIYFKFAVFFIYYSKKPYTLENIKAKILLIDLQKLITLFKAVSWDIEKLLHALFIISFKDIFPPQYSYIKESNSSSIILVPSPLTITQKCSSNTRSNVLNGFQSKISFSFIS